jgi:fatty-acyl-CoA synthase
MYIGDWLGRREMLTPDKVALVDTLRANRPITYREWNRAANRTANFLGQRLGVGKGERVAVLAANSVEYLDVWFALGKIGGVLQNLNWRLAARELAPLVADAAPKALIYSGEFASLVNELRAHAPGVQHYVALDRQAAEDDVLFGERDRLSDAPPPEVELDWDDPWVICYTGGTTGTPKGAVLTHRSIAANSVNTIVSWGLTPDDVAVLDAPLFHTGGLNVFTAPLVHVGGTSLVCKRFDPAQLFDLIRRARVTLYFGVPTMFLMLQQHPDWETADFARLKVVISGGAPCPRAVFEKFWARGVDFKTGYGLTEAGPNNFWLPRQDVRAKPGAVGFPLFHVDVKVCRPDGSECAPDEAGELVIRGPHVCAGYWNNPTATAEAIHPLPSDPAGPAWLHTGDLARRDADGYYYIVGRLKDMIISGGENVYPAEVEDVIHAHPAVAEAAVIGMPHPKWGEVGRAVVVIRPGAHLGEAELLDFVRGRLAAYKVPRSVVFVSELPKTGANKVDKRLLAEKYGDQSSASSGQKTYH